MGKKAQWEEIKKLPKRCMVNLEKHLKTDTKDSEYIYFVNKSKYEYKSVIRYDPRGNIVSKKFYRENVEEERKMFKARWEISQKSLALFNKYDPLGFYRKNGRNYDEYDVEMMTIEDEFPKIRNFQEFLALVYKALRESADSKKIGSPKEYTCFAKELYQLLKTKKKIV